MGTAQPPTEEVVADPSITMIQFLETVAPGEYRVISDIQAKADGIYLVNTPDLHLHCGSETCGGVRTFGSSTNKRQLNKTRTNFYIEYYCRNCGETEKVYALALAVDHPGGPTGYAFKYGEMPRFGPPTSKRLLALLGDDKKTFLKGRRSELQGLGVGAFAYYRRVVENQKSNLLAEIIKVAQKTGASSKTIETLQTAQQENQFSKAIDMVKDAIPESLKFNGHNPLTLLHTALSDGLHARTDEECLELATTIRRVMQDLAERVGTALKDHAELGAAVSRLMNRKPSGEET